MLVVFLIILHINREPSKRFCDYLHEYIKHVQRWNGMITPRSWWCVVDIVTETRKLRRCEDYTDINNTLSLKGLRQSENYHRNKKTDFRGLLSVRCPVTRSADYNIHHGHSTRQFTATVHARRCNMWMLQCSGIFVTYIKSVFQTFI